MNRQDQLDYFYRLIHEIEDRVGEKRYLRDCTGKMNWPRKGVYFFFEPGEFREDRKTPRVVRVGTHALKRGSKTTLWKRLRQHRGTTRGSMVGGGNHRGSIFRLHVGSAILEKEGITDEYQTWGVSQSASRTIRVSEYPIEKMVSNYIRSMPFIWLNIDDEPGPDSQRGYIERNSIAFLSNYSRKDIDPPSSNWLGKYCWNENVRNSGLWNSNHVNETVHYNFLDQIEQIIYEI